MSWTDNEIDELFSEAANEQQFEFKSEYFKDIEKQLPVNRSFKPSIWWLTGGLFIVMFSGLGISEFTENGFSGSTVDIKLNNSAEKGIVHSSILEAPINVLAKNPETTFSVNPTFQTAPEEKTVSVTTSEDQIEPSSQESILTDIDVLENVRTVTGNTEQSASNEKDAIVLKFATIELAVIVHKEKTAINELLITELTSTQKAVPELIAANTFAAKSNRLKFYAELAGGMEQGWANNESGNSINGSVSGRFGVVLPVSRFTLSAGLGIEAKKLNDLQIKERTKIYNFGYSTYDHIYKFSSIYSLHAPISLSYLIKRHSFALGIDPSVNLFTRLNRSEMLDDVQVVDRSGVSDVSMFNKIGLSANVGYCYSVNENLQIGLRMNMQLIQPISSDRFYGSSVRKPIEGQVFIRRTLDF
jgi:hypothetical protein